jgi:hypothetical protein
MAVFVRDRAKGDLVISELERTDRRQQWGCMRLVGLAAAIGGVLINAPVASAAGFHVYGPKVISQNTPLSSSCDRRHQETDTMIAADPQRPGHLVATWDQDNHRSNVTATSLDGGKSWRISTIPDISKCTGGSSDQVVDPWAAIGRNGAAYFASLPLSVSGFTVNRSTNGGMSWSAPVLADPKAGLTDDLPSVVAGPRPGRVFLTWSHFIYTGSVQTGGDVRFARSVDGAKTFSTPVVIHSSPKGKAVVESRLNVLSDGTLLDVFGEPPAQPFTAPQQTYATWSTNQGHTWSTPVRIVTVGQDPISDPDTGKPQYDFCCLFGVAVAPNDHAYLAYTKVTGAHSGRVLVARSPNGGRMWRGPRTVASVKAQTLEPAIAVAGDNTVGVTWYDFRRDKPGDKALTTDYWFAYSHDGGRTWHQHHLAGPFDLRTSWRTGRPLGVYQGLVGLPHGFAATFIEAKPLAKRGSTDVFFARISPPH